MSGIYIPGITLMIALLIALMIAHAGEIMVHAIRFSQLSPFWD
jgi:hypothetical protein